MIRTMRHASLVALACALAGCPIGNNKFPKPRDLSKSWFIDKVRLLAVQAEPAEIRPGESARFTALVTNPEDASLTTVWLACPPDPDDPGGIGFGCSIDPNVDFSTLDAEALAAAGFIGVDPFFPPVYTAPADLLDGLDEAARVEGVYVLVQAAVLPGDSFATAPSETDPPIDFNEVEAGYKRLVVSEALSPNHNPVVSTLTVEGVIVEPDTVVEVDPDEDYAFAITLAEGTVETYEYVDGAGTTVERTEEPYIHWYTDGGSMSEEITLFPFFEATWRAPLAFDAKASGSVWAVIRDRRGGMAWTSFRWRLRTSPVLP